MTDKKKSVAGGFFLKSGIIVNAKQSIKQNNGCVDIKVFLGVGWLCTVDVDQEFSNIHQ